MTAVYAPNFVVHMVKSYRRLRRCLSECKVNPEISACIVAKINKAEGKGVS